MEGKRKNSFLGVLIFSMIAGNAILCASDFPSMPSIDSPSMPSISGPSYQPSTPWRGSAPYVPSQQEIVGTTDSNTSGTTAAASAEEIAGTVAGVALTAQSISGLGGLGALDSLGGLEGLAGLSGLDSLDALKGLDSLSNLKDEDDLKEYLLRLAGQSSADKTDAAGSGFTTETDSTAKTDRGSGSSGDSAQTASPQDASSQTLSSETATLRQILQKLEELAAAKASEQRAEVAAQKTQGAQPKSASRILRFRANATDLLPTCTTVYFSQPDPAGIFLLTGDRLVKAGGKDRNETFYFLFTPTLDETGSFIYKVESQLMQDWTSDRSELYPLASGLPLTAARTGNLVTLCHSAEGWNLDLLLDVGEE